MKIHIWTLLAFISVSKWAFASSSISLTEFLAQVESQSPELKIEKSLSDEASARASGVRIPPPMVGWMQMKDGGGTNQGIEVTQEIPFPTKISKEKETRNSEAELQRANLSFRKNEIQIQARTAFFEFWNSFEKNRLLKEKRDWLKNHAKLARASTRSDSTAQIHLLGIESEADLLENEVLESDALLLQKRNTLKSFAPQMDFDQAEPQVPEIQIIKPSPELKSSKVQLKETELKFSDAQKNLKNQAFLPDLFIRYRGYNGNEMTPKSEETMIGITLPFAFFWQPHAESSEASARYQRAQAELQKAQVESEANFKSLKIKIESLEKQLLNLESSLLPRAHKRMKLVDNLSPRSMEGLEEHRSVMLSYLDLRIKAVDARMELEKSLGELMILVSRDGEKK